MKNIIKLIESDLSKAIGETNAVEGACLLIAQILQNLHGGEIVRIEKSGGWNGGGTEHYGVRSEDGEIMDGIGTYEDEEDWIAALENRLGDWGGREVVSGIDAESNIPGDESAAKAIAKKLAS